MQNEDAGKPDRWSWLSNKVAAYLLLAALCLIAYLPAFNNGFISDDYVILGRLDSLQHDFLYLFGTPPECFRSTSYLCFGILRYLFAYQAQWYYAFNLLLHLVNSILLWKLLARITRSSEVAYLAAVLFASIQGHMEAIMWLAAMNETLVGLCLLACMLLWEERYAVVSSLLYLLALFSKESALMLLGLMPAVQWRIKGQLRFCRGYLPILAISGAFVYLVYALASRNFMIEGGFYAFGVHAIPVFFISLHRMMFPWLYLAIFFHLILRQRLKDVSAAAWGLAFAAIALIPYIFLTYQNHVPSRQEYVASMGIAWALAILIQRLGKPSLRKVFIVAFVVVNIGYIWIKDRQMEQRAAPTNRLIEQLRTRAPQDLVILDFPANTWIAKNTTKLVPGWKPEMIHVDPPPSECAACPTLRWLPGPEQYRPANAR